MTKSKEYPIHDPTDQPSGMPSGDFLLLGAEALLKLLLDEDRLAILGMAAQHPCTVREMAAVLAGKRTPPAKHVAELTAAGLLKRVDDEHYVLDVRQVQQLKRALFARAPQPVPESSDEQVVATYVRGGKMIQYPAAPSKRVVVLRWLASHFEPDRAYAEREVNEILAGHSEDHATLRRFLVDAEMLVRQKGVYQLVQEGEPGGDDAGNRL